MRHYFIRYKVSIGPLLAPTKERETDRHRLIDSTIQGVVEFKVLPLSKSAAMILAGVSPLLACPPLCPVDGA